MCRRLTGTGFLYTGLSGRMILIGVTLGSILVAVSGFCREGGSFVHCKAVLSRFSSPRQVFLLYLFLYPPPLLQSHADESFVLPLCCKGRFICRGKSNVDVERGSGDYRSIPDLHQWGKLISKRTIHVSACSDHSWTATPPHSGLLLPLH